MLTLPATYTDELTGFDDLFPNLRGWWSRQTGPFWDTVTINVYIDGDGVTTWNAEHRARRDATATAIARVGSGTAPEPAIAAQEAEILVGVYRMAQGMGHAPIGIPPSPPCQNHSAAGKRRPTAQEATR